MGATGVSVGGGLFTTEDTEGTEVHRECFLATAKGSEQGWSRPRAIAPMARRMGSVYIGHMEISQRLKGGAVRRSRVSLAAPRISAAGLAPHVLVVGAGACLALVALAIGHFTAFYSVDGDIKYLGALNLAQHFPNPSIAYPSSRFDPSGRYTLPLTAWYNGHDYAGYTLPFLYVSAAAIALFGQAGLVLPAVLGTVALLYAQLRLADLIDLKASRTLVVAATVAATPVLFYSVSFWEHTWGVGLLLAGIAALLTAAAGVPGPRGQRALAATAIAGVAGLLFAGAVLYRRDTIVPAALCLAILPLITRSRRGLMLSFIAGAA